MGHPVAEARANAGPSGLIDTLQTGFNTTNHHLWLLLLPLVIDLLLWFGPQLTMGHALVDWADSTAVVQGGGGALERLPSGFLLAGSSALGAGTVTLVVALISGVAVWISVHIFFAPYALFVGVVGPVTALRRSATIVRHFFWESVVFVGLIVVIMMGFPI